MLKNDPTQIPWYANKMDVYLLPGNEDWLVKDNPGSGLRAGRDS